MRCVRFLCIELNGKVEKIMKLSKSLLTNRFVDVVIREGLYNSSPGNLRFYLSDLFSGITFANNSMLDIGSGSGLFSLYASFIGAKPVIALEPELEGSKKGVSRKFNHISDYLGLEDIILQRVSFQEFYPEDKTFDIILLHKSINHLNEEACINFQTNQDARDTYRSIFRKLSELANPGCRLIITDCSRYNFFALIRVQNPFAPSIEWHKHQSPKYWAKMLQDFGFRNPKIRWRAPNTLREFGKFFLGNKFASYFISSYFQLVLTKD